MPAQKRNRAAFTDAQARIATHAAEAATPRLITKMGQLRAKRALSDVFRSLEVTATGSAKWIDDWELWGVRQGQAAARASVRSLRMVRMVFVPWYGTDTANATSDGKCDPRSLFRIDPLPRASLEDDFKGRSATTLRMQFVYGGFAIGTSRHLSR